MSILIKSMEMPEKTYAHCMLIKDIDGSVQLHVCAKNSEEISEWEFYDLVPVPPHGDLIDRDALKAAICSRLCIKSEEYLLPEEAIIVNEIFAAPTIIPAEPPKEKT